MMVQVTLVTNGIEQLSMVNDHLVDQLVVTCYVSHVYIGYYLIHLGREVKFDCEAYCQMRALLAATGWLSLTITLYSSLDPFMC